MKRLHLFFFVLASCALATVIVGVINSPWSRTESMAIIGIASLGYLNIVLTVTAPKN